MNLNIVKLDLYNTGKLMKFTRLKLFNYKILKKCKNNQNNQNNSNCFNFLLFSLLIFFI